MNKVNEIRYIVVSKKTDGSHQIWDENNSLEIAKMALKAMKTVAPTDGPFRIAKVLITELPE